MTKHMWYEEKIGVSELPPSSSESSRAFSGG